MGGPTDVPVAIYPEQVETHNKRPWSGYTKSLRTYFFLLSILL
jgi:hypothetical protein